jgi:hypothetical protein
MSKALWGLVGAGLFVAMTFLTVATWLDRQHDRELHKARESFLQDSLSRAILDSERDSVIVVKYATRTVTLRDSLLINKTDTLLQERFILQTDTLRLNCMACVESAARLRVWSDSSIQLWKGRYESVRPTWRDRFGVHVGYGATKTGSDLKVGPQVGVSFRAWP